MDRTHRRGAIPARHQRGHSGMADVPQRPSCALDHQPRSPTSVEGHGCCQLGEHRVDPLGRFGVTGVTELKNLNLDERVTRVIWRILQ